jgi:predicted DNA-binding protein (UPF0278 family)
MKKIFFYIYICEEKREINKGERKTEEHIRRKRE